MFIELNLVVKQRDPERLFSPHVKTNIRAITVNSSAVVEYFDVEYKPEYFTGPVPNCQVRVKRGFDIAKYDVVETKSQIDEMLSTKKSSGTGSGELGEASDMFWQK